MKKIITLILVTNSLALFSQNYYYTRQDTSPLILLTNNSNYFIFRHTYNNYIYKMNYKKNIIDSIYINGAFFLGDRYSNDSTVLMGTNDSFNKIYYAFLDSNMNISKNDSVEINFGPFFISKFLAFKDRMIVFGNLFDSAVVMSISYNGEILESMVGGFAFTFSHKLSDSTFYFAREEKNSTIISLKVYKIDTTFNILTEDTIPKFPPESNFYVNSYKDKIVVSGNYLDYVSWEKNIATGIFDLNLDSTYAFDFFNLGDNYPYISGLTISDNNIYVANYLNLFYTGNTLTSIDSICVTCYDSTLNVKWRKIIGGDNNYHVIDIFPAPDGGCIFSMTIHDILTDTYDGAIVWLDSLGNQVLSIPQNIRIFNNILVYPNPGTSDLNVLMPENFKVVTFELYNSQGVLCKEELLNSDHININTYELKSGLYFYRMRQGNNVVSQGKWLKK